MNKQIFYFFALCLSVSVAITSCNPDETPPPNDEEVINYLTYTLTPLGGGDEIVLTWDDPDGDGSGETTVAPLQANTTYNAVVGLQNTTVDPAEDVIAEDIGQELEEHQFFFTTTVDGMIVDYNPANIDADGNPVGILSEVVTGDAGTGNFTIILRHEPDKNADGVADGDITNAGGETDIEVTFAISVE